MEQLEQLEEWLCEHRPDILGDFLPGASDEQLRTLESGLRNSGFPEHANLHPHIAALLKWSAGRKGENFDSSWFFSRRDIMSPKWMVESYDIMQGHQREMGQAAFYHPGWVGILDNSYSILCVDCVGTHGQDPGQIIYVDYKGGASRETLAPSLADWFSVFLAVLNDEEGGRYYTATDAAERDELWEVAYDAEIRIRADLFPGYPIKRTVDDPP